MDNAIIKRFNIYCDESRVENPDSRFMVIGALFIPRLEKEKITQEVNRLLASHKFFQELKWNKVGNKYAIFYQKLIKYFLQNDSLQFRCIIVDKQKVQRDYRDRVKRGC